MRYLVVTHLDLSGAPSPDPSRADRELAALGLLRSLVEGRTEGPPLPAGTYVGVFDRAAALALRDRLPQEVRASHGPHARVLVCIGSHWSLAQAA